jgi:hypothetical protein
MKRLVASSTARSRRKFTLDTRRDSSDMPVAIHGEGS